MKNRGDKEMVRAFDLLIQSLIICGLIPSLQRLDNEASLALRNYLTKQGIDYQLAPPHIHRWNVFTPEQKNTLRLKRLNRGHVGNGRGGVGTVNGKGKNKVPTLKSLNHFFAALATKQV
jgi:hypothetical protein